MTAFEELCNYVDAFIKRYKKFIHDPDFNAERLVWAFYGGEYIRKKRKEPWFPTIDCFSKFIEDALQPYLTVEPGSFKTFIQNPDKSDKKTDQK